MNSKLKNVFLNVLLAEDNADDRFFFGRALKEISITTNLVTVDDGEQLMNYLAENSEHLPDILFLDLSMPGKTGFECLSEIKENKKLKDLPVIMFTVAFPSNTEFEMNIKNVLSSIGADGFISKTSDLKQLKQNIHTALIGVLSPDIPGAIY